MIGIMVAVATLANGLVQKLFGMVTFLPDQVITWVGGHAAKFGHPDDAEVMWGSDEDVNPEILALFATNTERFVADQQAG